MYDSVIIKTVIVWSCAPNETKTTKEFFFSIFQLHFGCHSFYALKSIVSNSGLAFGQKETPWKLKFKIDVWHCQESLKDAHNIYYIYIHISSKC